MLKVIADEMSKVMWPNMKDRAEGSLLVRADSESDEGYIHDVFWIADMYRTELAA